MASVSPFGGLPSGACGRRISFDSLCLCGILKFGSDTGIRTRVSAVRGRRPGPLDDIAKPRYTTERRVQLAILHFHMSKTAPQDGRPAARNFVSFEAISESVPHGVLVSGIGQMVGERKPFSDGEILLGLSPGGVIAMLRRSRLRLSDWKLEFHIHFNSYPQGRGEKD